MKIYYDGESDFNDVVLVAATGTASELFVNDQWTAAATVDGNQETAGVETSYVGVDAFDSTTAAFAAMSGTFNGTLTLNGIDPGSAYDVDLTAGNAGNVTVNLVGDLELPAPSEANVTIGTLTGAAGDEIVLNSEGNGNGNLIVKDGSFGGVISEGALAGNLEKTTAGTLTLSGANTYTGATTISAGVLSAQNDTALGTAAAGTTVADGATLNITNTVTIAEAVTITGTGDSTNGAINNDGTNTLSGAITLAGASEIQSDSGTLTLSGGITGAAQNVTFDGAGDTTVTTTGITTTTGTLTKNGAGTLSLNTANTYTGQTTVSAGILALNNGAADNTTIVGDGSLGVAGSEFRHPDHRWHPAQ